MEDSRLLPFKPRGEGPEGESGGEEAQGVESRVAAYGRSRGSHWILVGDHTLELPEGVSAADWALEKRLWQNPRIRSMLGCIDLLDDVLESNYAILHCSPERLHEIWSQVRQVSELIRSQLSPLFEGGPSKIPKLEQARLDACQSLELLDRTVLTDLERFPREIPSAELIRVRKLLCVSIGKLHAFLQDTFGLVMASDPRSVHGADYFMSKRFPRDIEEAEWLMASVGQLQKYMESLEALRCRRLGIALEALRREQMIPVGQAWEELREFLELVAGDLASKLRQILALRGIRFDEMEILDHYVVEVPIMCRQVIELGVTGREAVDRLKLSSGTARRERGRAMPALLQCHAIFSRRIARLLGSLDRSLKDLWIFVPFWLESIERRRALLLQRQ